MPNFTVVKGRIAKQGVIYEEGDKIALDDHEAAPLLDNGMVEPVKRGRPAKSRKAGWTRNDDDDNDDSDDDDGSEGGDG